MHSKAELYGIFVGAETGLLKGVTTDHTTWQNLTSVNKVSREKEITSLCWQNDDETELCVGHRDGSIDIYSSIDKEVIKSYTDIITEGYLRGLAKWNNCFVTCTDKGKLQVINEGEEKLSLDVGADIYCLEQHPEKRHIIATGGKENDLKIWNLEQPEQPVFKAKNVRNDWLNLRVPIWVRDVAFVPGSDKIVTCTGYHQVRVYDPATPRRRPVIDIEIDEYPLTSLSLRHGYQQAVVGNTQGLMALVDFRGKAYVVQKYKGFAGSIRDIQCHPSQDIVVSCSLDRFLRIHDINTKQLLNKFYMKSRLNCCLVADKVNNGQIQTHDLPPLSPSEIKQEAPEHDIGQSECSEDEQLWSVMGVVKTKQVKTRASNKNECLSDSDSDSDNGSDGSALTEEKIKGKKPKSGVVKRKHPQCHKGKKKCKADQK